MRDTPEEEANHEPPSHNLRSQRSGLSRWALPLALLLGTTCGLAAWMLDVPIFEATYFLEASRDFVLNEGFPSSLDLARTERTLITHALVLDPVLADPKLRAAPSLSNPQTAERQIRDRLAVGNAGADTQLTISYRDNDKEMAAKVCNAIAESYLKVRQQLDEERFEDVESWLSQPIEQWKRNVENLRSSLSELSLSANGYDPFRQEQSVGGVSSKLMLVRSQLLGLEAEEAILAAQLRRPAEAPDGSQVINPPVPEVVSSAERLMPLLMAQNNSAENEQRVKFALVSLLSRREALQREYEAEEVRLKRVGGETAEVIFVRDDYERALEILKRLKDRLETIRVERGRGASVHTLASASTPVAPVEEIPFKKIGLATLVGFLLPLGLSFVLGFRRGR